jgi:hypothetical protein
MTKVASRDSEWQSQHVLDAHELKAISTLESTISTGSKMDNFKEL